MMKYRWKYASATFVTHSVSVAISIFGHYEQITQNARLSLISDISVYKRYSQTLEWRIRKSIISRV